MDHSEFREEVEEGLLTSAGISQYIFLNVSTKEEREKLNKAGIFSAVEILEGNYYAEQVPVIASVVAEWNKRLGFECFYERMFR